MRRRLVSVLGAGVLMAASAAGVGDTAGAQNGDVVTETFDFTGDVQAFTVPDGVTEVDIVACGAQGQGIDFLGQPGGRGGQARTAVAVTAGEELTVVVGGSGVSGGFNGGEQAFGRRGGGASDVRQGGTSLADRVVIGGGGGGAGARGPYSPLVGSFSELSGTAGGAGGGVSGGSAPGGGDGGTATSGGQGGGGDTPGGDGVLGQGGQGAGGIIGGGGGGGGLYGGGGGGSSFAFNPIITPVGALDAAGGGGGSGLGDTFAPGTCTGHGVVAISYSAPTFPSVTPGAVTVAEGDGGTVIAEVPVSLSEPSTMPVTVDYVTADFTATAPDDYVAGSGTVTFAAGETGAVVPVTVNGDLLHEADEVLLVSLRNPTNATVGGLWGLGFVTITDDDPEPVAVPWIGVGREGDSGTTQLDVPVFLSAPSGLPVTLDWVTHDLTAHSPEDYQATSGTVTIDAGDTTGWAKVTVNGDDQHELPEAFLVAFGNPDGATLGGLWGLGAGVIIDDDDHD